MVLRRSLIAAAATIVVLLATCQAANAYTATFSPGGEISAISLGKLLFNSSAGAIVACNVTLSGELNESVNLTAGESLGEINEASTANCEGGRIREFTGFPWNMRLSTALGTLPDSGTGLAFTMDGMHVLFAVIGEFLNCGYTANVLFLWELNDTGTNTYTTALMTSQGTSMPRTEGTLCPSSGRWLGTLRVEPQQTITVR